MASRSDPRASSCSRVTGLACRYYAALATIERLAGYPQTALRFDIAAALCVRQGCGGECAVEDGDYAQRAEVTELASRGRSRLQATAAAPAASAPAVLTRSRFINIARDAEGNYIERRDLDFAALETRRSLGDLHRYWLSLRRETACRVADIDTVHLVRAGIIGRLHIVDVASSDPRDFRYKLFGHAVPAPPSAAPRSLFMPLWAEAVLADYNTARLTGAPRLQRIRARSAGIAYHYTRLILPFFDAGRRTSHLAIATASERGDGVCLDPDPLTSAS